LNNALTDLITRAADELQHLKHVQRELLLSHPLSPVSK